MIDNIMNEAIESDNHDKIMSMFNSGVVPVKVMLMNGNTETRWCNTKDMDITYYEDLDSTQQELLQQTYKDMDYDKMVESYDNEVEKTDPYNLKSFGLSYTK